MNVINWVAFGGILVDLVIISIILSSSFWGYRKGLVAVIFKILTFIIALIIMFVLYKPVSNSIIKNTSLDEKLSGSIYKILMGTTLEDGQLLVAEQNNISNGIVDLVNSFVTEALNEAKSDAVNYASVQLAYLMIRLGTMLGLFIISRIFLLVIRFVAEMIGNLPIIRTFNKSGGLIYGIIKGFLTIYLLLAIISVISPFISDLGIVKAIEDSSIGSRMYNNNIILNIVLK